MHSFNTGGLKTPLDSKFSQLSPTEERFQHLADSQLTQLLADLKILKASSLQELFLKEAKEAIESARLNRLDLNIRDTEQADAFVTMQVTEARDLYWSAYFDELEKDVKEEQQTRKAKHENRSV